MSPTDYLPPWHISGDSGEPIGPAMTTLRSVAARLAAVLRCAGIAYLAVQVAIWHRFYQDGPWRLAGPVAATAWAVVVVAYLRRRWPSPLFACIDSAVYAGFALSIQACVPPATRGDPFSWLVIIMWGQLVVPAWYAPAALAVPLAFASPVVYRIGAGLAPSTGGRPAVAAIVAAHAGTGEAWVEVSRTGGSASGRLGVTVRDSGAGFDPARVEAARLGLRRSITERLADCGGQASIWSAPGRGTVVRISWPGAAEPARGSPPW